MNITDDKYAELTKRYMTDNDFKAKFEKDPEGVLKSEGVELTAEEIAGLHKMVQSGELGERISKRGGNFPSGQPSTSSGGK
jgi:hypothetical protein